MAFDTTGGIANVIFEENGWYGQICEYLSLIKLHHSDFTKSN